MSSLKYSNHIVITHYPPIFLKKVDPSYKIEKYISYYENGDIILKHKPIYWIFGHIHQNFVNYKNGTLYLSNQYKGKGYDPCMNLLKI